MYRPGPAIGDPAADHQIGIAAFDVGRQRPQIGSSDASQSMKHTISDRRPGVPPSTQHRSRVDPHGPRLRRAPRRVRRSGRSTRCRRRSTVPVRQPREHPPDGLLLVERWQDHVEHRPKGTQHPLRSRDSWNATRSDRHHRRRDIDCVEPARRRQRGRPRARHHRVRSVVRPDHRAIERAPRGDHARSAAATASRGRPSGTTSR